MEVEFPDPQTVPVGTVLPFLPNEVPEGWEIFDGRAVDMPEFHAILTNGPAMGRQLWHQMGGSINDDGSIGLPNPTQEEARAHVFGSAPHPEMEIVLAIKAKRPSNS
jgi:hypothetical protein